MAHHHHHHDCVNIAWFNETEWQKLKAVAADADKLASTYDEWTEDVEKLERQLHDKGEHAHRIPVEVDTLARWCTARKRPLNGEARADYAAAIARRSNLG
ncbi:hypothetical protein [Anatilimnocola floriformis]|uniref:hypothetical protein n=1 Tax=Anatilimnocola floriformis TaxID=2948575 RepID=UPI0020C49B88|nr:hypothetical protein [Anatilimnocola floriformis]